MPPRPRRARRRAHPRCGRRPAPRPPVGRARQGPSGNARARENAGCDEAEQNGTSTSSRRPLRSKIPASNPGLLSVARTSSAIPGSSETITSTPAARAPRPAPVGSRSRRARAAPRRWVARNDRRRGRGRDGARARGAGRAEQERHPPEQASHRSADAPARSRRRGQREERHPTGRAGRRSHVTARAPSGEPPQRPGGRGGDERRVRSSPWRANAATISVLEPRPPSGRRKCRSSARPGTRMRRRRDGRSGRSRCECPS